jgi:AcrR family transcriptional regulator
MPLTQISLRERKHATQKLKILDTFDEKLKEKSLADISVKEIAKELEISEMTFFNYFGSKKEVLIYFIELWSLEMQVLIEGREPMESIYLIFEETSRMIEKKPNLFKEIVSAMALYGIPKKDISITKAERILRFDVDIPYREGGFFEIITPLLLQIESSQKSLELIYLALFTTCFALPLAMKDPRFGSLKDRYVEQLDFILKAYK